MLLFTGGNVGKTTEIMDIWTENQLLAEYHIWAQEAMRNSSEKEDPVGASFFSNLVQELGKDVKDVRIQTVLVKRMVGTNVCRKRISLGHSRPRKARPHARWGGNWSDLETLGLWRMEAITGGYGLGKLRGF